MAKVIDPELLASFAAAPVLNALPLATRTELAGRCKVVELRSRDVLWREGDKASTLGVVLLGRLAVERTSRRRVMVDVAGAGDVLGEVALSLGSTYQFDVRCLRRARVALVPALKLREALRAQPEVAVSLSLALAEQVLRLSRRLETLCAVSVSQRLARVLLGLTERFGTPFPGGTLLPVRLRREDLASLAATTIESASRQISVWKREGLLVPQPFGFLIKDLVRLRTLCGDV